jgi:hypothetical protein
MIFFTFVLLGYPERMFVKLTQVNLYFLTWCFFYLTSVFFARSFYYNSIFLYPDLMSRAAG